MSKIITYAVSVCLLSPIRILDDPIIEITTNDHENTNIIDSVNCSAYRRLGS